MAKRFWGVFPFLVVFWLVSTQATFAAFEKIDGQNNKFGIHLAVASEEDLEDAAALVNSAGGDWGYATVVIEENDRDGRKWQDVFDKMRRLHLIPIVRLATSHANGSWRRPLAEDAVSWADFLDSLNWVIKNRYVVLFNEPNDGREWGGSVDPENYGKVALAFAATLKEKSQDFFILPAGFNATAPHQLPQYEREELFLRKMASAAPGGINGFFTNFDGWASHSYQTETYLEEINLLKRLGLKKNLPVFVTEAGWPHAEGINYAYRFPPSLAVGQRLRSLFSQLLGDSRVIAVTPFILNYQGEPFDHFSFRKLGSPKEFYPQYQILQEQTKTKGEPRQEQKIAMLSKLPEKLIKDSTYEIPIEIKNEGQAIWGEQEGYALKLTDSQDFEYFFSQIPEIAPFQQNTIKLFLKTKDKIGKFDLSLSFFKNEKVLTSPLPWPLEVVPLVKVKLTVKLFPKKETAGNDFKFLIYDEKERVIFEKTGLEIKNGHGEIEDVRNLAIGQKYRLVILKPFYLPRQEIFTIGEKENNVAFKPLLPFDFDEDGKFSGRDLLSLLKNPGFLKLFWPR
ncbi:hypothetical protein FJZ40_02535 [Candidatus Shapirobacteria bacterium]|nr:hypothetical protein [Candidatus Shapirobacteria bacterium]